MFCVFITETLIKNKLQILTPFSIKIKANTAIYNEITSFTYPFMNRLAFE